MAALMPDDHGQPSAHAPATRSIMLHPGDVVIAERDEQLETLLGSCVTVILTDRRRTLASMCHIVHWSPNRHGNPNHTTGADAALQRMASLLQSRGMSPRLCEAFVYGGGNMFPQLPEALPVGELNAQFVVARLHSAGIPIRHCDLGGAQYRRLRWIVGESMPKVIAVSVEEARP